MIRPTKYLDLNTCVLNVAATVLPKLQEDRMIPLEELDATVRSCIGDTARFSFLSALNFLFLLGKLDYDKETDTVVFLDLESESQT